MCLSSRTEGNFLPVKWVLSDYNWILFFIIEEIKLLLLPNVNLLLVNKTHNEIKMFNLQKNDLQMVKYWDKLWWCSARQFKTSINLGRLSVTRHLFGMITEGDLGNIIWIASCSCCIFLDSSWCEDPNPCLNGNCTDVGENFTCSCEEGFEGERCEIGENWSTWSGWFIRLVNIW